MRDDIKDVYLDDTDPFAGLGKLPRSGGPFMMVPLAWLTDRQMDVMFPPTTRLYLYLVLKSWHGAKPVKVTGAMMDELGLRRKHKSYSLRRLERAGLAITERVGHAAPVVVVLGPRSDTKAGELPADWEQVPHNI
jgi:hypothetical protein